MSYELCGCALWRFPPLLPHRTGGFLPFDAAQIERTKRSYECKPSRDSSFFRSYTYFRRLVLGDWLLTNPLSPKSLLTVHYSMGTIEGRLAEVAYPSKDRYAHRLPRRSCGMMLMVYFTDI